MENQSKVTKIEGSHPSKGFKIKFLVCVILFAVLAVGSLYAFSSKDFLFKKPELKYVDWKFSFRYFTVKQVYSENKSLDVILDKLMRANIYPDLSNVDNNLKQALTDPSDAYSIDVIDSLFRVKYGMELSRDDLFTLVNFYSYNSISAPLLKFKFVTTVNSVDIWMVYDFNTGTKAMLASKATTSTLKYLGDISSDDLKELQ